MKARLWWTNRAGTRRMTRFRRSHRGALGAGLKGEVSVMRQDSSNQQTGTSGLELQLRSQRRTVDFDTFDIHMQQLLSMVKSGQIKISPAYQRKFRWDDKRCSQLIESIMLGIPVPSLFMATDADSTWEVVDGVQRLSAIVKFAGDEDLRRKAFSLR